MAKNTWHIQGPSIDTFLAFTIDEAFSNVVAYTMTQHPPLPYRLKSSSFNLQIPSVNLAGLLPDTKFFRVMLQSGTWHGIRRIISTLRTWSRRTIWGDRVSKWFTHDPSASTDCRYQLFLQFYGPTTILFQTRASRLSDVLTTRDVNEIADTPPGAIQKAVTLATNQGQDGVISSSKASAQTTNAPTRLSVASIGQGGKVSFEETDDFKAMSR